MQKYIDMIVSKGADAARVIDPSTVVTAPWTLFKCQFGCRWYGNSFCCPPKTPDHMRTQEILNCYNKAILFFSQSSECIPTLATEVSRELFLDGFYKAIAFGSGPCRRCTKCGEKTCNFPKDALPSMEACGIDVFATARANGFVINVLRDKSEPQTNFGLLLIE